MSPDHPECPRTTIFQRVVAGVQSVGLLAAAAAAGRYRNPVTWNVEPHARAAHGAAAQWALVGGKPGRARYRDVSSPAFRSSRVTGPDEHAYGTQVQAYGRAVVGADRV